MARIIISAQAPRQVIEHIGAMGHQVYGLRGSGVLPPVCCHADMFICRLAQGQLIAAREGELTPGYPQETAFNALAMGKYLFCRTRSAAPRLLTAAKALGMTPVPVKQGYAACSVCRVTDSAAITADMGMADTMEQVGIRVLRIRPGHIRLDDYDTGFIGGACGQIDGGLLFFGDVSRHPDAESIIRFLADCGVRWGDIKGLPLCDLGGLVQTDDSARLEENIGTFTLSKLL